MRELPAADAAAVLHPADAAAVMHAALPRAPGRVDEWLTRDYGYTLRGVRWLEDRHTGLQHLQIGWHAHFGHLLRLDGALQCSEFDEFCYHEPLVHTALVLARQPQRALIVGGGDGGAAEEALKWPGLAHLDQVEIDAAVIDACREPLRAVHRGALDGTDPRMRLSIGDGRAWLEARNAAAAYDAVILDLTDPGGPSMPLHDAAFYRLCRRALRPGGVLTLHIASPWAHPAACAQRIGLLAQVFERVMPFSTSVPMSGGPWLMAACGDASLGLPRGDVLGTRLAALRGPRLRMLHAGTLMTQFVLPPYVQQTLTGEVFR
jgi:spermidine synthase